MFQAVIVRERVLPFFEMTMEMFMIMVLGFGLWKYLSMTSWPGRPCAWAAAPAPTKKTIEAIRARTESLFIL